MPYSTLVLLAALCLFSRAGHCDEYAVAAANQAATEAAMRMLAMGGSAADAAVAIQAVLGVVEPQSSGLGGGAIALYRTAETKRMTAYDGLATSPSAYDPAAVAAQGFSHSGAAVGVPGALRLLELMHRQHGKLPWGTLFQPAIGLAEHGFPVSPYLARSLAAASRNGMPLPEWLNDGSGKPVAQGAVISNHALAETLRVVANQGADALYGKLAGPIVAATHDRLTVDDMANYRAIERQPLCMPYREDVLCAFPPPSYGGVAVLEILGILEMAHEPGQLLGLESVHRFVEAGRLAEADRMVVGDPDTGTNPVQAGDLLSPAHLQARAAMIKSGSVVQDPNPACAGRRHAPEPSTSQIAVVDVTGDALAMTTTINTNFGSWLTVGGFFLNDAMTNFSERSEGDCPANAPAAGKRPETSMAPVIATDQHASVVLVGGSAGGGEIVDYVAQDVLGLLAGRMPRQVLDEGHVSTSRAPYPSTAGMVELEQGRAIAQLAQPLAALGHRVRIAPLSSGAAFIVRRAGHWEGAADPRRDGTYAVSR